MSKEPERIINGLSILNGRPIRPGETLLILDEIQECNEALNTFEALFSYRRDAGASGNVA
jgi:hypothetical protein